MTTKSIWCDECKLKVYDCDHLRGKNAAPEVPADMPSDPGKRLLTFLAFGGEVAAFSMATIRTDPQLIVKPRRLVVDPTIAPDFMLMDIKIGNCSHFASYSSTGASCAIFPPTPPKYEPIANLAGLPVIQIGQYVCLVVRNKSNFHREFNALMWCDIV